MTAALIALLLAPITPDKLPLIPNIWPRERRALEAEVVPLLQQGKNVDRKLIAAGVPERFVRRLHVVPSGPLLVERFAHGLVLGAPELTHRQRAVLEPLVLGTDAAQWALWVQRDKLVKGLDPKAPGTQRIASAVNAQIRAIEVRFWRVIGYVLTIDQRAALHELYPQPYVWPPDLLTHIYQLPELTATQASRIRALVAEYESESAADVAESQRIQARLRDPKTTAEERNTLQRAAVDVGDRLAYRLKDIAERSWKLYTPQQVTYLRALVPMVTAGDRARHPGEIVKEAGLTPEQMQRCHVIGGKLHQRVQANQKKLQERLAKLEEGEFGSDAPQSMMMQGMHGNAHAQNVLAFEDAGREALLEVFTPRQIVGWVVGPR